MATKDKEKIFRLLTYRNLLNRFKTMGLVKVFSDNIADSLEISSSLVRKDFSVFGIKGAQKGGYQIDTVLEKINKIIGYDEEQKVVIIGAGRIGEALMKYKGFQRDGIKIIAGFDIDSKKINEKSEIPVYHIDLLSEFVKTNHIRVAILAVTELVAQQTLQIVEEAGIEGILNFTPVRLKSENNVAINSINIEHELANLLYFVNRYNKQ